MHACAHAGNSRAARQRWRVRVPATSPSQNKVRARTDKPAAQNVHDISNRHAAAQLLPRIGDVVTPVCMKEKNDTFTESTVEAVSVSSKYRHRQAKYGSAVASAVLQKAQQTHR